MTQARLFADDARKPPREVVDHTCEHPGCGLSTGFGLDRRWLCREHLPPDYFPAARQRAVTPDPHPPTGIPPAAGG